jgi:hypothetical protein
MKSGAKLFGHPIHQMLIVFPLGLLAMSLVFDVIGLVTRPSADAPRELVVRRVALYLEACDPAVVIALDREAGDDLAEAVGLPALRFGEPEHVRGRVLLAVDGLEASLADAARKKRVWAQLRSLRQPGPETQQGRH